MVASGFRIGAVRGQHALVPLEMVPTALGLGAVRGRGRPVLRATAGLSQILLPGSNTPRGHPCH